jgi:hypothetical protein
MFLTYTIVTLGTITLVANNTMGGILMKEKAHCNFSQFEVFYSDCGVIVYQFLQLF